jgi:hypothetical protein
MLECEPCMHECLLCVVTIFPAIESNDECAEEGEDFEYQEEEAQGQADQGKPSTCCISKSYMPLCIALLLFLLLCIVFVYCYVPYIAIVGDLAPQINLISSFEMTPIVTYVTPLLLET